MHTSGLSFIAFWGATISSSIVGSIAACETEPHDASAWNSQQDAAPDASVTGASARNPSDVQGQSAPNDSARSDAGASTTQVNRAPLPEAPKPLCGSASPRVGVQSAVSITVGSAKRSFVLSVPSNYNPAFRYPLVFGFHGDGGNGANYRSAFPIETRSGNQAIFVWPNGTNNHSQYNHSFDQANSPPNNPDVRLFDAIVESLAATYCVDSSRVYAHGFSGGAYFVNQLGRWRSSALRAIAPMSGGGPYSTVGSDYSGPGGALATTGPLAAFIVHGQNDGVVALSEGEIARVYWRNAAGAFENRSSTLPSPCERHAGGTKAVVFCSVPSLGHTLWGESARGVWDFFAAN